MSWVASPGMREGASPPVPAERVVRPFVRNQYRSAFTVAGMGVEVWGNTPESVELGPQLLAFGTDASRGEINVRVEWQSRIEPGAGRQLFHSGCLWSVHELGSDLVFDFVTARFGKQPYKRLVVDQEFRQATVILNQQFIAVEDAARALEYPLDELLITHYLSLGRGVELHGCGIVDDSGKPFLFVGHSGAGKSTTARLWTEHGRVQVLSDDRIIVRRGGQACPERSRRECPTHLESGGRGRPPYTFHMHGTPWHGEAEFALPASAPVQRIFLLEHGTENRLERVTRATAAGELLARSFTPFYASRFVEPVLSFLEEMAESVPCYRFQFVPDQSAVEKILDFRD